MANNVRRDISIQIELEDHSPEVLAAVPKAIRRALWAVGSECSKEAASNAPVDTGLLKNSITFALGGEGVDKPVYWADKAKGKHGPLRGNYSGTTPPGDYVLIGSNLEYAAAQELGTSRGIRPKHYLKNAVANNTAEYKKIITESFRNV